MAKKEKLISGFENLFSSPNLQNVLGQLGSSGGYTPTADALSVPFGVTFEQGQQLVKNAIDRDTTAAAIESEKMRTKAEQERIKVAREGLELEKQREAKNDLSESEQLARQQQFDREQASTRYSQEKGLIQERTQQEKALVDYGIESKVKNAERLGAAEGAANAARFANDPQAQEEFDLKKRQADADIAQSYARANASNASAAYYAKQKEIQAIDQEIAQIKKVMLLEQQANGGVVDVQQLNQIEDLIQKKARDYETLNMETGEEGVSLDVMGSVRKVEYGALIEAGALNWRSVKHHFDLEEQAEFAEWEMVKKSGDPEKIAAWNFKSLAKEQEVYREAEARKAEQQRLINEAAGGSAPPQAAVAGEPPTTASIGKNIGRTFGASGTFRIPDIAGPGTGKGLETIGKAIGSTVGSAVSSVGESVVGATLGTGKAAEDNKRRRENFNWPVENMDISGTAKKVLGR